MVVLIVAILAPIPDLFFSDLKSNTDMSHSNGHCHGESNEHDHNDHDHDHSHDDPNRGDEFSLWGQIDLTNIQTLVSHIFTLLQ
jgi:ABC-type Zn2+ transport system substrate-binding protein/surface adhesin